VKLVFFCDFLLFFVFLVCVEGLVVFGEGFCLFDGFAKSLCIQLMSIVYGGCVDA